MEGGVSWPRCDDKMSFPFLLRVPSDAQTIAAGREVGVFPKEKDS